MRICHVVGDSSFGGGSKVVLDLASGAISRGDEVDVIGTDPVFVQKIIEAGATPIELGGIGRQIRPWADVRSVDRLRRLFERSQFDIVHTHTSKAGVVGRLAARLAKVRGVVHTVHGFAFHERSSVAATLAYTAIERMAARWCDRLVTVSTSHREIAIRSKIAPAEKVIAIPNGVRAPASVSDAQRRAVRRALELRDGEVMALALGRLAPQKGFRFLLDAARMLKDDGVNIRYFIAGDGPIEAELRAHAESNGLSQDVEFLGFRSDIDELFAAADLVVQPSLWEGLSISLLEALARRRAVVTTRIASNVEVASDGAAILVEPGDSRSLAQGICALGRDAALRERVAAVGFETYQANYTVERMQSQYLRVYDSVVAENREGSL